jgi:hypothetical protein
MQSLFVMQNAAAALEEIAAVDASIDLGDRDVIDAWGLVALSALAYQKSLRVSLDGAGGAIQHGGSPGFVAAQRMDQRNQYPFPVVQVAVADAGSAREPSSAH